LKSREEFINFLKTYQTDFKEEQDFISRFQDLLQSYRCYHRDHLPGHITGSAWIIDDTKSHALLVHHAKLRKWLQPGGHADGDENILSVALREADEETGLKNLTLLTKGIFDLDIHLIPARKDFPEHLHYDVRFAFTASLESILQISDESRDLKWIKLDQVSELTGQNTSINRMIEKTLRGNQH
jgi:8-oxo-dGTP pyrophosphatase MutT (NUDIX family)